MSRRIAPTHAPDPCADSHVTEPPYTRCGLPYWAARIAATDEAVTCRSCLRLSRLDRVSRPSRRGAP